MKKITHIDDRGCVRMVDITNKNQTIREAIAQSIVIMSEQTIKAITDNKINKGNVLETSRIAGIMAAKKTSTLIPMCHPLNLTHIHINFFPNIVDRLIRIEASVSVIGSTGVEMEALTAVSVSSLTMYDMCKSYDRRMSISNICLLKKSGGKSGVFIR